MKFLMCSAWSYGFEPKLRVFTKPYSSETWKMEVHFKWMWGLLLLKPVVIYK